MDDQSKLLVAGHGEFGDSMIMNGLIRVLARKEPAIVWITGTHYLQAVQEIVADLPNVEVCGSLGYHSIKALLPAWPRKLCLGVFNERFNEGQWDSEFYRQAGIPFEARWSECRFPSKLLLPNTPRQNIVLIHEKSDKGWLVRDRLLPSSTHHVRITQRPSILDWLPEIFAARELHFIDSSFLNLAESLYAMGFLRDTHLCFHQYAKVYTGAAKWPVLRAPWRIFD